MSTDFDAAVVGTALPSTVVELTRADLRAYADASGDRNPIHLDEAVARSVGLPDVIAHGMLTMGLAGQVVAEWAGGAGSVVSFATKFTNPVVVPSDGPAVVEIGGTVVSADPGARTVGVDLTVTSAGVKVLGRARAVVRLP